ncbi:MAG: hypothetical protein U0746_11675 [Gemmataceae bacterium]
MTPQPIEAGGLHNVFRVSEQLISGSGPEGDEGFASLAKLGVRTIISVDGAKPEAERAKKHGLGYVHLPIGYDGIPRGKLLLLAKAARELRGPVYVHCHHGKHRGPAAVAAIQLCNDPAWTAETAEAWLKIAGTDPTYAGLIGLPRSLVKPSADEVARTPAEFRPAAPTADLTRHMVEIDALWDRLKLVKAADWTAPRKHPDIDPPHEAVLLTEHFKEAARLDTVLGQSPLAGLFADATAAAAGLEAALRAKDADRAAKAFAASATLCSQCHERFRDNRPAQ